LTSAFSDRRTLQEQAYADDAKLSARQAIYEFIERPWPSSAGRVLGAIELRGDELVVDCGCGNGNDLRDLIRAGFGDSLIGVDLSLGMLRTTAALGVPVVNADVAALPLPTASVDVALAMHMLYHCPSVEAAVAELRRVVRPGGALVVSTNSLGHLRELGEAWTWALDEAGAEGGVRWGDGPARFNLEEGGEVLARSFANVALDRVDNRLLIPHVEPVVAYVESVRDAYDVATPGVWERAIRALRARVDDEIRRSGAFAVSITKGVFVCR
jgi:SAM-dependent methyltransferase